MKRERNRIRILRAERRLTQLKTALRAKLQPSRLSLIENDHVEATESEREALARVFNVAIEDVFPVEAVAS